MRRTLLLAALMLAVAITPAAAAAPYEDRHLPTHKRVDDLLSRMTLDEKLGQMTQTERAASTRTQPRSRPTGSARSCPAAARRPRRATRPRRGPTWSTASSAPR
jgi:beta-glucosidase